MNELELINDTIQLAQKLKNKKLLTNIRQLEKTYLGYIDQLRERDTYISQLEEQLNNKYSKDNYVGYAAQRDSEQEELDAEIRSLREDIAIEEGYDSYEEYEHAIKDEMERESREIYGI